MISRVVHFVGVDPLALTDGAARPMIPESWRFGFSAREGDLIFGVQDQGPLVAREAVEPPPAEAALLEEVRMHAEHTRHLVNRVQNFVEDRARAPLPEGHAPHSQVTHPGRWAALAQTELQSGFMKLVRAIEQPVGF